MHAVSVTMETAASSGTEFVSMPLLLIKDEPHDDPEMADTNFAHHNPPIVTEPDPMNLLDPMDDSQVENSADSDETSDQQQQQAGLTAEIWQAWMAEYPWLLHEEADENDGYCLYCNIKVSYKLTKTPRNHALSRNHREYEENYLAFKESEDQANMSALPNAVTIKQEFGTDSDISAIKFKRTSQTEPLFNFIWRRWLKRHTWLERDKDDMTHGYCKYCKLRICVEYSYMRMRHEVGIKHRIAVKRVRKSNRKKNANDGEEQKRGAENLENESEAEKQSELGEQEEDEEEQCENGQSNEAESAEQSNKEGEDQDHGKEGSLKRKRRPRGSLKMNPWLELQNNHPQTARCKLCNVKMHASNFQRHLHTQVHQERERNIDTKNMAPNIKQEISIKGKNWKLYSKKHHWLVEDPDDANFAYCKFCKKRLLHGIHQMKRLIHERGEHHKRAAKKFYRNFRRGNAKGKNDKENDEEEGDQEQEEEDQQDADETNQDAESEQNNEENEEQNDYDDNNDNGDNENDNDDDDNYDEQDEAEKSRTRYPFGSDKWYSMFPWCKRFEGDPKYMYCTYCKTKLKLTFRRKQHECTTRHQDAEKTAKNFQQLSNLERSRQDRRIKYYPWLVYTKNPQYVFCKYCRVRLQSGVGRAKHETTKRHKESGAAYKAKKELSNTITSANTSKQQNRVSKTLTRSKPLETTQPPRSMKSKVTMWRHRFPWLTYRRNELQPNYGYCKYCEMRVYLLTEKYALKHQKSLKHIRIRMQLKRQESQSQVNNNEQIPTETEKLPEQDFNELNKDYPWLLPDKHNDPNYGFCKYCNVRINTTGILKNRHQQTIKHTKLQLEVAKENAQKADNKRKADDSDAASDAIVLIDDDDDEMNDNSVKLEPMSEDDVLEYLLQRSEQAKTSKDCRDPDTNETMEPPNKRQQTSSHHDNLIDRAKRLTTAHLEILRLSRDLNDRKTPKKSGRISLPTSIFNTSAAIAALLSPPQAPPTPATPPTRNNFELFFDSVCESVKTLPSDLAAEGKIKIAQLVADLEMRALQRSQSKDYQNTNSIQITATPMSSGSSIDNASPTLSNADMPSTTTNGLDKEHTSPPTHGDTPQQQQSMPTYSLDSNLRIIPISSTPNYRHSDATTDTNVRRMQLGTPQVTTTQIKRIQINPAYQQQSAVKQKPDGSASRVQSYANTTPTTVHTAPQRTQNHTTMSSPSTQTVYQHAHQIVSSSPDSVGSPRGLAHPSHTHNNATLIDNGIRRIHVGSRPQPVPQQSTQDLGFRRIHLPFKGTTITKTNTNTNISNNTNAKPSSSSFYVNHSQNA